MGVGAVEDGEIIEVGALRHLKPGNPVGHNRRLVEIAVAAADLNWGAGGIFREHLLAYLLGVLVDKRIGSGHDALRGTVVLLQLENLQVGVSLLQI